MTPGSPQLQPAAARRGRPRPPPLRVPVAEAARHALQLHTVERVGAFCESTVFGPTVQLRPTSLPSLDVEELEEQDGLYRALVSRMLTDGEALLLSNQRDSKARRGLWALSAAATAAAGAGTLYLKVAQRGTPTGWLAKKDHGGCCHGVQAVVGRELLLLPGGTEDSAAVVPIPEEAQRAVLLALAKVKRSLAPRWEQAGAAG